MTHEQKQRLAEINQHSPKLHGIFARAFAGNSRSAAVKAKCLDCCCYQRIEVAKCTTLACPLWPYRPYQAGEDDDTPES